jgi:glutamate racemase
MNDHRIPLLEPDAPIGVFDSGVGGLSVLRAIQKELPGEKLVYLADQANVPYGSRSLEIVQRFSEANTRFLLGFHAKIIVVACNTASAAALQWLRQEFSDVPFVGMEPAVKPAAAISQSGVVGVLATPATFQGALYASVVERFARGVRLLQGTCPGLVSQIETGELDSAATRQILEKALAPMQQSDVDTIVLGCTHYPFVIPLIEEIVGDGVRVIDPAPAVARQARRLLEQHGTLNGGVGEDRAGGVRYYTTGDAGLFEKQVELLTGLNGVVKHVDLGIS